MLTAKQIINLARKQEWWNEFDKKRKVSIETLAHDAVESYNYRLFMTEAFWFDSIIWCFRTEQFAKLCKKEEENKNPVPEYDLAVSEEVVARFYTHGKSLTNNDRRQMYALLRANNISYDYMEYNTKEKVLIVYKHSSSWVRR